VIHEETDSESMRRRKARRNNLMKRPRAIEYGEVGSPDASIVEYAVIV
jgi:hypothetical protein